jgi:hypothetical protein
MSGNMIGVADGDKPVRPMINPDPYPSGIYSALSYPSIAETAPAPLPPPDSRRASGEVLARIGDIDVTSTTVCTPAGEIPLAGATLEVTEEREVRTPTWAVLCAIIGFFVVPVVSLLFLLAKETRVVGPTRVTVSGSGVRHETLVADAAEIDLARSLAAS